jgi:3'(2'), 5'-bisphosphate nucleotidase
MIGLLVEQSPVLGVIYQPSKDLIFRGAQGIGAQMIDEKNVIHPLHVSTEATLSQLRLVVSQSHRSRRIDPIKQALGITAETRIGSVGLKISLLARNQGDLYVHPSGRCKLWDICAPEAVIRLAGGQITDLRGNPLQYRTATVQVPEGIVASNGICHDAVIERLAGLFQDEE